MSELNSIRNFLQLGDRLATSGMPLPEDFATIRIAGFDAVINLAMPTSDGAMPNEGDLVASAGMTYVHIPVNFEMPLAADFQRFTGIMQVLKGQSIFVHCAANMRVSAFVFLHRVLAEGVGRLEAERNLKQIWNPDGIWRDFINQQLDEGGQAPLS